MIEMKQLTTMMSGIESLKDIKNAYSPQSSLQLILEDGSILLSVGNAKQDPLDQLVNATVQGRAALRKCEKKLLKTARRHRRMFVYPCHTGLRKYAFPLYVQEKFLGVAVSGGFRKENFDEKINILAEKFGISQEEIKKAIAQVPEMSKESRENLKHMLEVLINQVAEKSLMEARNGFLAEALSQHDLKSLLEFIVSKTPGLIWDSHCSVFLWDALRNEFVLARTSCSELEDQVGKGGYAPGEGLTGWVGKYGVPLLLPDLRNASDLRLYASLEGDIPEPVWSGQETGTAKFSEGDVSHIMIVPIQERPGDMPIGVIRLAPKFKGSELPTNQHLRLFSQVGQVVHGAVQNSQLTESILKMAEAVGEFDVGRGLQILLQQISLTTSSFSSQIRVKDQSHNIWSILAIHGPYEDVIRERGANDSGRLIEPIWNGTSYYVNNNVQNDKQFQEDLIAAENDDPRYSEYLRSVGAVLIFPLRQQSHDGEEKIIGLLNLHRPIGGHFSNYEIDLVKRLLPVLEQMITNLKQSDRKRGEDAALKNINFQQQGHFNRQDILKAVLSNVLELVQADLVLFRRYDENSEMLKLEASQTTPGLQYPGRIPEFYYMGERGSGRAAQDKRTYFIPDGEADPLYRAEEYHSTGSPLHKSSGAEEVATNRVTFNPRTTEEVDFLKWIKSFISVPMWVADYFIGVLVVIKETPHQLTRRDVDAVEAFADRSALVLRCAELVEREVQTRFDAWLDISAQAAHRVGNRIETVSNTLGALRKRIEQKADIAIIENELLPRAKAGVEDAKMFLWEFRQLALPRPLKLSEIQLNDLVRSAVRESQDFKHGVDLNLSAQMPTLVCDPMQIKHCFAEIIQNAHDAGAKKLDVRTNLLSETNEVEIHFCNDGAPIPAGKELKIFEPLYTTKKHGTGLGLSMVQKTLNEHGGSIRVNLSSGHETCITVLMPLTQPQLKS